jgi:glycosyltransferase involved in cell wall biosynthesis
LKVPNSIIEALFSKVPVITNKLAFSRRGGPDSIYIDPTKPDELSDQINILLNNPDLRASISAKGLNLQKFNDIIANKIMTVYTNLNKMTTNPKYNIVIDVDRLKYPFTGMHQFCLHLYKTLSG